MYGQEIPDPQEFTAADQQELMGLLTPRLMTILRKAAPELAENLDELRRGFADPFDDEGQSGADAPPDTAYQHATPPMMASGPAMQPMVGGPSPLPSMAPLPGGPLPTAPDQMADPAGLSGLRFRR